MAKRNRTARNKPPELPRCADAFDAIRLSLSPKASLVARWISELPDAVPIETRNALEVDLGLAALDYTEYDAASRVADREADRIIKVTETLEELAPGSGLTSAAQVFERWVCECATSYSATEARNWRDEDHPFIGRELPDGAYLLRRPPWEVGRENQPSIRRVQLADKAYLIVQRSLAEVGLPTEEVERLALKFVKLIGHEVQYRPPRDGSDSIFRAHQGRPKSAPKPDPLAPFLDVVVPAWPEIARIRDHGLKAEAARFAVSLRKKFPRVPEGTLVKRLLHQSLTRLSLARFLWQHSRTASATRKTSKGNIPKN